MAGTKVTADVITETFTMPDRFTLDVIVTPNFQSTTETYYRVIDWTVQN
mgnify:CR=1 FL=1